MSKQRCVRPPHMLTAKEQNDLWQDFKTSAAFVRRYWRMFPPFVDGHPLTRSRASKEQTR